MSKNLVLALAVLIATVAVSGGVIMAQQYQANNSANATPTLSTPTCPCGGGCDCTANGQPCSCGQNGATCGCGANKAGGASAGQCHKAVPTP
ncbi:MAG: hypothetical protein PHY72_00700 [Candidatus Pacebacteria bacterium]|nr:hypothetical protein [Candidatus Paceibacterota bacterium]